MRNCPQCGKPFETSVKGHKRIYCSDLCKRRYGARAERRRRALVADVLRALDRRARTR